MKLSVALFFAGLFGALAAVFILLSFGTDYWLLASESCHPNPDGSVGPDGVTVEVGVGLQSQRGDVVMEDGASDVTLYHEGFFWRCSFGGNVGDDNLLWKLWFTNQPHSKICMHAYLFPFPVSHQTHNATEYETAIIYRGFWSIFMLIGVAAVVLGGFVIICAAPFASPRLYKAGGGLFLASGVGCGGCLRRPPALYTVSRLPAVPQLRAVLHVRPRRHLLLPPGRPSLPPHWPNHPD
ncbi:transmembrane protein 182 isoform X3 [Pseudoliparis swirei]|uniref:transmembrane protein 182 isoform X3 n=1 Tax=Pseudoliparis swirei TaxID=2059687 RepID=UPI0024BD6511|nr:transmembrane protein 182 isoform X3 [Pseudoliparis swirei]